MKHVFFLPILIAIASLNAHARTPTCLDGKSSSKFNEPLAVLAADQLATPWFKLCYLHANGDGSFAPYFEGCTTLNNPTIAFDEFGRGVEMTFFKPLPLKGSKGQTQNLACTILYSARSQKMVAWVQHWSDEIPVIEDWEAKARCEKYFSEMHSSRSNIIDLVADSILEGVKSFKAGNLAVAGNAFNKARIHCGIGN